MYACVYNDSACAYCIRPLMPACHVCKIMPSAQRVFAMAILCRCSRNAIFTVQPLPAEESVWGHSQEQREDGVRMHLSARGSCTDSTHVYCKLVTR